MCVQGCARARREQRAGHVALIIDKKSINPIINFDFVEVQAFN